MEKIREFLETSLRYTIAEIQDENIRYCEMHDIGHIREIAMVESWANEKGATEEIVFSKALEKYEKLEAFIKEEDEAFNKLDDASKENFVFSDDYKVGDGRRCMLYEFLENFGIVECDDEDGE